MAEQKTKVTEEQVIAALRDVFDPEIPVNVYDLGLVYNVQVDDDNNVYVQMTLTAAGCGMGPHIAQNAQWRIAEVPGVGDVQVELVWDPPWNPDLITPEGKKLLGID
ncbi:MAG: metal-sulfur cluster assembly factor [Chloroflexi bacterium]|nr:metal-sulfur cluster assembly factor [Chloroflexota bacterium]